MIHLWHVSDYLFNRRLKVNVLTKALRLRYESLLYTLRCVLYSSVVGEPMATPEQHASVKSGTRRHEEAMTYLGPSMDMRRRCWLALYVLMPLA